MSAQTSNGKNPTSAPIHTDPNIENLKNTFVSIEYPGRVLNDHEAFKTMGGIDGISAVHSKENRKYNKVSILTCLSICLIQVFIRIELRFRPNDPFCKPTHGEQTATSNLLIRLVKKTRRNKITNEEQVSYETKLEGVITKTYRFLGINFTIHT